MFCQQVLGTPTFDPQASADLLLENLKRPELSWQFNNCRRYQKTVPFLVALRFRHCNSFIQQLNQHCKYSYNIQFWRRRLSFYSFLTNTAVQTGNCQFSLVRAFIAKCTARVFFKQILAIFGKNRPKTKENWV